MKKIMHLLLAVMLVVSVSALQQSVILHEPLDNPEKSGDRDDFPKIIEGYIYSEDGIEMPIGTELYAEVIETGSYVYSSIKYGVPGLYSVGVTAELDHHAFVYSWNDTHWGQTDFVFADHVMYIDVYLNNTFPNRPPELELIGDKETFENVELTIEIEATDMDHDTLTHGIIESLPSAYSFDAQTGLFTWTPTYYDAGIYEVTFTVTDGQYSDNETINITVIGQNGPPVLSEIGNKVVFENDTLAFNLSAEDPDIDDLEYSTTALFGTLDVHTGIFEWTPTIWDSGVYEVTFFVTDGEYMDSEALSITVNDNGAAVKLKPFSNLSCAENSWVNIYPEPSNPVWHILNFSIDSEDFFWDPILKAMRWQTGYSSSGEYEFEITVSDGTSFDQKTVYVTIQNNCHTFDKGTWAWNCDVNKDHLMLELQESFS